MTSAEASKNMNMFALLNDVQVIDALTETQLQEPILPQPKVLKQNGPKSLDEILEQEARVRVKRGIIKQKTLQSHTKCPQTDEYPELGDQQLTKAQQKAIEQANRTTRYFNERSECFVKMSNKTKIAKSLKCTKACRNVTNPMTNPVDGKDPEFGVCVRDYCTFAHSLEELEAPLCGFDGHCNRVNGRRDPKTKKKIPGTNCRFRHSFETVSEWIGRANISMPPLPDTNEHSRKPPTPTQSELSTSPQSKKHAQQPPKAPVKPKKKREWGPPMHLPVKPKADDYSQNNKNMPRTTGSDFEEIYSSSSSGSEHSDNETGYKHRRRHNHSYSKGHIIRVQTNELAEMAIKAAFDRGIYNVQVIVE